MHDPAAIETVLSRLMPPALSETGQRNIETMLDELAAEIPAASTAQPASRPRPRFHLRAAGIAAILIAIAVVSARIGRPVDAHMADAQLPVFELVSESDRVESVSDDGWRESPEGSALRALRMRVVEENSLLDRETGIVMRISEPRDELLLMPVSAF